MTRNLLICTGFATLLAPLSFSSDATAQSASALRIGGRVTMADGSSPEGARITLGVDVDRSGTFTDFETATGTADGSGSYTLRYTVDLTRIDFDQVAWALELIGRLQGGDFEALTEDGPLLAAITFEKEGYSTVTRNLLTLVEEPTLDALLTPLEAVGCADGVCGTDDGSVLLEGLAPAAGVARGYAHAFDPALDTDRFPGVFADDAENLLVSSGFAEVDLRAEDGTRITRVEEPVTIRYELDPASWATLTDQQPDSGAIELPMYSFDEAAATWVPEADGLLVDESDVPIDEGELPAIVAGDYAAGPLYVRFQTLHFSYFNVDEPRSDHACVKGRLVDESGSPLSGVEVVVEGVSYQGSVGSLITAADGLFAAGVLRSRTEGEHTARVNVSGRGGFFFGAPFQVTTENNKIVSKRGIDCAPGLCDCPSLGDVTVRLETPTFCEVSVRATYSGLSGGGEEGPLAEGDPLVGGAVQARVAGLGTLGANLAAQCEGEDAGCGFGALGAEGAVTVRVPVVGEAPEVEVDVSYSVEDAAGYHSYRASAVVDCGSGSASVEVEPDHLNLGEWGSVLDFLLGLQTGGGSPGGGGTGGPGSGAASDGSSGSETDDGCGCRLERRGSDGRGPLVALLLAVLAAGVAVSRRRG